VTIRKDYAPYDRYESFDRGCAHYFRGWTECPYHRSSIDAQSSELGHKFARKIYQQTFRK
jgi:hypothetical protein